MVSEKEAQVEQIRGQARAMIDTHHEEALTLLDEANTIVRGLPLTFKAAKVYKPPAKSTPTVLPPLTG